MTGTAARGFSIVELLIAAAVMSVCGAALLSLVIAGQRLAVIQPEAADQQQRARTVIETLAVEFASAGAGMDSGARAGPLAQYFAPIAPSPDGGVTIFYVGTYGGQGSISSSLARAEIDVAVDAGGRCPSTQQACAFAAGSTVLIYDSSGCRDADRIESVFPSALRLRAAARSCAYGIGAAIAEGEVRTYRVDAGARQLLRRDEGTGTSLPVMDNVAGMSVEWLDAARHVRVTLRFVSVLLHVPDLVVWLDAMPPNVRERW